MFSYNDNQYKATLVRVVDGDTVYLEVDLGFNVKTIQSFRLIGIDTPEIRGAERPEGLKSKAELERLITNQVLIVQSEKTGKFGRWLGTIFVVQPNGEPYNVNEHLLREGFAKEYG